MRPLLVSDAFVRTYLGEAGRFWVLVRGPGRARVRISAELKALLDLCDGGRRPAQIALAASARVPRLLGATEVERVLAPLVTEGVLVDLDAPPKRGRPPREIGLKLTILDDQSLESLRLETPAIGLGCHGKGGCCFLYDRLRLEPAEVARIAAAYGDELTPGGLSVESAISRERADEEVFGLAVSGGGCVLLEADGACGVHRRTGIDSKPGGCRAYPLRDVKCGDALHVSIAVECRCAIDFAAADRSALLAEAQQLMARRRRTRIVEEVADEVSLIGPVPRSEYVAWRAEAGARLEKSTDVLEWARTALPEGAPPEEWIGPLKDWLAFESADLARLYDAGDLQRRLLAWADAAGARLDDSHPPVEGERIAAQQLLFGHGFLRHSSVAIGLTSFALRLMLARAGAAVPLPPELLPIVCVEYLGRVYSLGRIFE